MNERNIPIIQDSWKVQYQYQFKAQMWICVLQTDKSDKCNFLWYIAKSPSLYICHNSFKMDFSVSATEPCFCSTPDILNCFFFFLRGLICSQQEPPCLKRRWLCTAVSCICLVLHIKNEQGAFSCSFYFSSLFSTPFRWCCLFTQRRTQLSWQR